MFWNLILPIMIAWAVLTSATMIFIGIERSNGAQDWYIRNKWARRGFIIFPFIGFVFVIFFLIYAVFWILVEAAKDAWG